MYVSKVPGYRRAYDSACLADCKLKDFYMTRFSLLRRLFTAYRRRSAIRPAPGVSLKSVLEQELAAAAFVAV